MAKQEKHPPSAHAGGATAIDIIGDDVVFAADSQAAHAAGKFGLAGNHMGEVGVAVGDVIDIEKDSAWNMGVLEFLPGIPVCCGQMKAGVDNNDIGSTEIVRQPFG